MCNWHLLATFSNVFFATLTLPVEGSKVFLRGSGGGLLFLFGHCSLLWRETVVFLGLLFKEGGHDDKHRVSFIPVTLRSVSLDHLGKCLIGLEQIKNDLIEGLLLALQFLEELNTLLGRVPVVVLLDRDITAADTDHAVIILHCELLHFGADEVRILLLQLGDRHEDTDQLHELLQTNVFETFNIEVFIITILFELRVENILGLFYLSFQLFNKLDTGFVLFGFFGAHELDLEPREPLNTLENLINGHFFIKRLVFRVVDLLKVEAAWLCSVFVGIPSNLLLRRRRLWHWLFCWFQKLRLLSLLCNRLTRRW